jgi:hypothetical protein
VTTWTQSKLGCSAERMVSSAVTFIGRISRRARLLDELGWERL